MIFDFRLPIFDLSELLSRNSRFSRGYCVSTAGRRQGICELQDSQRKRFGSFFHFIFIHACF
jgi:hypothetical protein